MSTAWVLTKGMTTLRNEFNDLAPGRDKASDGSVGDLAHQQESASSHNPDKTGAAEWEDGDSKNEVRAIDVDDDLRVPGLSMEIVVQHLVTLGRQGKLAKWVRYLIYNRRIWSASNGWATQTYTGASAHTEHLHVTGAFSQTADENTNGAVFEFGRIPVALTSDDKDWLSDKIEALKDAIKGEVISALKTDGVVTAPANGANVATNPSWGAANTLTDIAWYGRDIDAKVDKVLSVLVPETTPTPPSAAK